MSTSENQRPAGGGGSAFLLTQLGSHAAQSFAARVAELDLTPPQTGLLRAIALGPGRSQQALAQQLGTPANRLVSLVDGLEQRDLLERRRNPKDRRLHAVYLSDTGHEVLADIGRAARKHDDAVLGALSVAERQQLYDLLSRVATDQGLTPGVHPGHSTLRAADTTSPGEQATP